MIPVLSMSKDEVVFQYHHPVTGKHGAIAVNRLYRWCAQLKTPLHLGIELSKVDLLVMSNVVELERLRKIKRSDILKYPAILVNMGNTSVLVDGNHRYCKAYSYGFPSIPAYHLQEHEWQPFRVSGLPEVEKKVLLSSWSGIS